MFESLPVAIVALSFVGAAIAVWFAGIQLAGTTDRISDRFALGQATGGLIILAIATNLPEIAISVAAARSGNFEVAVGNILGGIAIQTVVLVIIDATVRRRSGPLTYRASSLVLAIEGLFVVGILAAVLMAAQLPDSAAIGGVGFGSMGIAILWLVGLFVVRGARSGIPWTAPAPSGDDSPSPRAKTQPGRPFSRTVVVSLAAAIVTLASGWVLAMSGDALSEEFGLSGVLFGATFLALATSLPEISTGIAAARAGEEDLAISDIFGGNAFLPVLFLLIALVGGRDALSGAQPSDLYLTALGIVLTIVFVAGLMFRSQRRFLGIGRDSAVAVLTYAIGLVGLIAITIG